MLSAEHQCVLSQLMLSAERGKTRRVELELHEARARARVVPAGALASDSGVHGFCGADCGSQTVIEYQGAMVSSNVWVTSRPGWATVGRARGSTGRRSVNVDVVPGTGLVRDEPHGRLVVPDVLPVLVEPAVPRAPGVLALTAGLTGFWMGLRPLQSSSPTAFGATPVLAACAASVVAEVSPASASR